MAGGQNLLGQAKTLGGVGAIFLLLTFVPYVGAILGIVGLVMILVAVKNVSDAVNDRRIFNNMTTAIILAVAGILVGGLIVFGAMFRLMGLGYLSGPNFNPVDLPPGEFVGFIVAMVVGLLAIWALYLVSAIYFKRSFDAISSRLNVKMFHTAALVYLVGAALTIVLVGFLLIFVAEILFVVAFFSIPDAVTGGTGVAIG